MIPAFFNKKAQRVVFFHKRGSLAQRNERLQILSIFVAEQLRMNEQQKNVVERLASLCKFDLQTQMVSEFPSLQGVIGAHYARLRKEDPLVSEGIREHYHPRFAQDSIPRHLEIAAVAIADKLDMLATAFSLDLIPTGSADPYALRRMAQGIIQIVLESKLLISLHELSVRCLEILNEQQDLSLDIPGITGGTVKVFCAAATFFHAGSQDPLRRDRGVFGCKSLIAHTTVAIGGDGKGAFAVSRLQTSSRSYRPRKQYFKKSKWYP